MLVLIASVSRTIALEESLGMEAGLEQVAEFVEGLIAAWTIAPVDDSTLDTVGTRKPRPDQGWAIVARLRQRSACRWP